MPSIPPDELTAFYRAIERGEIALTSEQHPQKVYAGDIAYAASNGWEIVVFNDCNELDYVDHVRTADGREIDFDEIDCSPLDWQPDDETAWVCFGIPGYMTFRCTDCGAKLRKSGRLEPAFLCGADRCVGQRSPPVPTRARTAPGGARNPA